MGTAKGRSALGRLRTMNVAEISELTGLITTVTVSTQRPHWSKKCRELLVCGHVGLSIRGGSRWFLLELVLQAIAEGVDSTVRGEFPAKCHKSSGVEGHEWFGRGCTLCCLWERGS